MTYTQLQPGQAPAFGTSGQGVSEYQTQLNKQNEGKSGWTPLAVDGLYGTKTLEGSKFGGAPNGFVGSSSTAKKQFMKNSGALAGALQKFNLNDTGTTTAGTESETPSDPFTVALDNLSKNQDNASKALIASIQAKSQQQKNTETQDFDELKRGMALLGIEQNLPQEVAMGRYTKIKNDFNAKITQIDGEETKALLDAQNARDEKNLSVLKQKMDYVKQLKRDKIQALKDVYDQMHTESNIADIQSEQIYDTMQSLNTADREAFLHAVAEKYNIPVPALVTALSKQKDAKAKKSGKGTGGTSGTSKFTTTQVESSMKAKTGEDGYIDPQAWVAARNRWLDTKSGSISTFNSLFKKYLNPESYSIAGFGK